MRSPNNSVLQVHTLSSAILRIFLVIFVCLASQGPLVAQTEADPFSDKQDGDDPFAEVTDKRNGTEDNLAARNMPFDSTEISTKSIRMVGKLRSKSSEGVQFSRDGNSILIQDFTRLILVSWPKGNQPPPEIGRASGHPGQKRLFINRDRILAVMNGNIFVHGLENVPSLGDKASFKTPAGTNLLRSDGQGSVACVRGGKSLYLVDLEGGETIEDISDQVYSQPVVDVFITDSGKQLLSLHPEHICLVDLDTKKTIETLETPLKRNHRFSRDGRHVIGELEDRKPAIFNIQTGQYRPIPSAIAYSPDYNWAINVSSDIRTGSFVVFQSLLNDQEIQVPIDLRTDHTVKIAHHPTEGKFVLTSAFDSTMFFEYPLGQPIDIWSNANVITPKR